MPDGILPIAGPVVEEADALVRADVVGRDAEDHVPLVERIGVIVPVGEDTGVEIVSVGQGRGTTETGQRPPLRRPARPPRAALAPGALRPGGERPDWSGPPPTGRRRPGCLQSREPRSALSIATAAWRRRATAGS